MKRILLATAFAFSATAALAGGLNKPTYEATVVPPKMVEKAAVEASDDEWVLALMTFLTIVVLGVGGY